MNVRIYEETIKALFWYIKIYIYIYMNICPKINLDTLPNKIFGIVSKEMNWFELVKLYNIQNNNTNYLITNPIMEKICKEKKCKKKNIEDIGSINLEHLLQFLGSYRKVIIDSISSQTIATIDKSYYKDVLNIDDIPIGNFIISSALGSDNITSDYDITFTGPGVYKIVSCLTRKFNEYVNKNIYNGKKKTNTMTAVFDSNFYLMPDIVVNKKVLERLSKIGIRNYFDMEHEFPSVTNKLSLKRIIPIPEKDIIDLELNIVKNKILAENLEPDESIKISKRYDKLVIKSKEIDTFLYGSDKDRSEIIKIIKEPNDFFKKVMEIKQTELEAYYCVSTILVIVFGMQAGKFKTSNLYEKLEPGNFLVGAVENIIDLVKHQSHNFNNIPKKGEMEKKRIENNRTIAVKFSKYFQRILTCIDYYFKKNGKKNPFSKDLELINKVVKNRKFTSNKWGKEVNEYINKYSLLNKLTFSDNWIKSIENSLMEKDKEKFKNVFVGTTTFNSNKNYNVIRKKRSRKKGKKKHKITNKKRK